MTTGAGTGEADRMREEIQKTRAELGETAQALAAKADPKALGREAAEHAKDRVRQQTAQTAQTVRETAVRVPTTAGQKTTQGTKRVGQKAWQGTKAISQKAKEGTEAALQKGGRGVEVVRKPAYRAGSKIRAHPAASTAIAAVTIAVWALQRRRKTAAAAGTR